jgi:hypothetical protein
MKPRCPAEDMGKDQPLGRGQRPNSHPFSSGKKQKSEARPLCPAKDVGHAQLPLGEEGTRGEGVQARSYPTSCAVQEPGLARGLAKLSCLARVFCTLISTPTLFHVSPWLPEIETVILGAKDSPPQGGREPLIICMGAVIANGSGSFPHLRNEPRAYEVQQISPLLHLIECAGREQASIEGRRWVLSKVL